MESGKQEIRKRPEGEHLIEGEFQSDKYPTCPRGKVPLSTKDLTAQDLLWEYARRRRSVDAAFSTDLEQALLFQGYVPDTTAAIDRLAVCKRAIRQVLNRIKEDDVIRHHLGVGTQTFTLVCLAASQLFDEPIEQLANHFIPGSGDLTKRCAEGEL